MPKSSRRGPDSSRVLYPARQKPLLWRRFCFCRLKCFTIPEIGTRLQNKCHEEAENNPQVPARHVFLLVALSLDFMDIRSSEMSASLATGLLSFAK